MPFVQKLKTYLSGIIISAAHPLKASKVEGINKKIKVIERMAYVYRDMDYFFLKIGAVFFGVRR